MEALRGNGVQVTEKQFPEVYHLAQQLAGQIRLNPIPAIYVLLLGTAYSKACEYTCDRYGAHYKPDGAAGGLLVLAASNKLYPKVNVREFSNQAESESGFWIWLEVKIGPTNCQSSNAR
jgi:hypothetical protein